MGYKQNLDILNKEELTIKLREIINILIQENKLKYSPFKIDLSYFNKDLLKEGIKLYSEKLKNIPQHTGLHI